MKRYVDEIIKRIDELTKIYEQYIWKNEDDVLAILFIDNMIILHLIEDGKIIDEVDLAFEEKERKFYLAVCLRTFALLLGNVMVYRDQTDEGLVIYHNEARKPYLMLLSEDEELTQIIDDIVNNQEEEYIKNNSVIKKSCDKVKRYLPNTSVIDLLDNRIELSKEMLRGKK